MAKRWSDFEDLQGWLTSMAVGMNDAIGTRVTDLFVGQGKQGIKALCKDLDGEILYLPMMVTPDLAELFESLETEHQRHANALTVASYKRDIDNNRWIETGDAIRFNTRGELIDGGHRADAIKQSGKTVRTLVVFGVDPEASLVIDSGRTRTMGNTLTFHGISYAQELGGVIPRLLAAETEDRWVQPSRSIKLTREEVVTYLTYHPELPEIVAEAKRRTTGRVRIPRATGTAIALVLAVLYRAAPNNQAEAHQFIERVTTGEGIVDGMAEYELRGSLTRGAPAQWRRASRRAEPGNFTIDETLALFFSAWNRRHETNVKAIRVSMPLSDENFPRPKGIIMKTTRK